MRKSIKNAKSLGTVHTRVILKDRKFTQKYNRRDDYQSPTKNGITLISLIVTIIILLILAGVTLSLIGGSEGILGRSTHVVDENEKAMAKEQVELALSDYQTEFFETKYVDRTNDGTKKEYILEKLQGEMYTEKYKVITSEEGNVKVYEKNGVSENPIVIGKVQEDGSIKWDDEVEVGTPDPSETEERNEEIQISVTSPNVSSDFVKATVQIQVEYLGTITEIAINGEKVEATKGENGIYQIQKEFTENGEYKIIAKDENGKIQTEVLKITDLTEDMEIWNRADMELFRDKVKSGRTFQGRTARLMDNIDLEGSSTNQWIPIKGGFAGTFEGNYHTIHHLYIDSSAYGYMGLFEWNESTAVIQNMVLENVYFNNTNTSTITYTGGIVGRNYGIIRNCGINSGTISNVLSGSRSDRNNAFTGAISGQSCGTLINCYNKATVSSTNSRGSLATVEIGGMVGDLRGELTNCYNAGSVSGNAIDWCDVGGLAGHTRESYKIINSYSYGNLSGTSTHSGYARIGGLIGMVELNQIYVTNSYCTTNTTLAYTYGRNLGTKVNTNRVSMETLQGYASTLGSENYENDGTGINNGYPILKWQLERK